MSILRQNTKSINKRNNIKFRSKSSLYFFLPSIEFILQIKFHNDLSFRFMCTEMERCSFTVFDIGFVLHKIVTSVKWTNWNWRNTWTRKMTHLRATQDRSKQHSPFTYRVESPNDLGNGKHLQRKSMSLLTGTQYGCQINYLLVFLSLLAIRLRGARRAYV